jgi:hypothetical protein
MVEQLMETVKEYPLSELTEEELYDLADETEDTILGTEELQRWLIDYHEDICKELCDRNRRKDEVKR